MERLVDLSNKKIDISGPDGNALFLLGKVKNALRWCGVPDSKIEELTKEAMSGDYNHLCKTVVEATGIQLVNGNDSEYL